MSWTRILALIALLVATAAHAETQAQFDRSIAFLQESMRGLNFLSQCYFNTRGRYINRQWFDVYSRAVNDIRGMAQKKYPKIDMTFVEMDAHSDRRDPFNKHYEMLQHAYMCYYALVIISAAVQWFRGDSELAPFNQAFQKKECHAENRVCTKYIVDQLAREGVLVVPPGYIPPEAPAKPKPQPSPDESFE